MMDQLAEGGTCAVIVPEGLLFGSTNAHLELRKKLVEQFNLLAVVSLPAGVFKPYAGVKTSILVFKRPYKDSLFSDKVATEKVWFYEIKNDGYDPDKITGGGRPETAEANDIPRFMREWKNFKNSNFKEFPGIEGETRLPHNSREPKCWWTNIGEILDKNYNISASNYKPSIETLNSEIEPSEIINNILIIEKNIVNKLESLSNNLRND